MFLYEMSLCVRNYLYEVMSLQKNIKYLWCNIHIRYCYFVGTVEPKARDFNTHAIISVRALLLQEV